MDMNIVCLDLEGVLVPEIWIAFAEASGIPELKRTTRDEPDYDKLMKWRIGILKEHGLGLKEIQDTIAKIDPIPGAKEFLDELRSITQAIIISDTFSQFAGPLMKKLGYPTIFCNSLEVAENGEITGFKMRVENSKYTTVKALQSIGFQTIASGDSHNDLGMIQASKAGFLFKSTALFCLMAIVAGLKAVGVFDILAKKLLMVTSGTVGVIRLLVLLCFFLSMVITNDVALITFVPFALIIVHKLPKELGNYWLLKIVAMQTIAANLGSMLTPIGNPQNLYLYARAGMSAAELITLMLPYSATALILLLIWIQVATAKAPHVCGSEKDKTLLGFSDRKELNMEYLAAYLILFTICLLTVARIIPYQIPLVLVLIYMLLRNRENISRE